MCVTCDHGSEFAKGCIIFADTGSLCSWCMCFVPFSWLIWSSSLQFFWLFFWHTEWQVKLFDSRILNQNGTYWRESSICPTGKCTGNCSWRMWKVCGIAKQATEPRISLVGIMGNRRSSCVFSSVSCRSTYIYILSLYCVHVGNVDDCSNNKTVYGNTDISRCPEKSWLAVIMFAAYMIMTNILLLNLLIAMFRYDFTF